MYAGDLREAFESGCFNANGDDLEDLIDAFDPDMEDGESFWDHPSLSAAERNFSLR